VPRPDRRRVQIALRVASLGFVVLWLFSRELQDVVPYQLPFAVLLATETEFLVRSIRERRQPAERPSPEGMLARRLPGGDDADLGWGRLVETDDGVVYVPPPARAPRPTRARALMALGIAAAIALFVLAARADRESTWDSLPAATRARAEALFTREAGRIAGRPVTVRCDAGYDYTGSATDALGVAFPSRGLAFLEPRVCRSLADLALETRGGRDEDTAQAVLVLAHEAVHLAGELNEGITECRALQEGVRLGVRLGLPEDRSQRLMSAMYRRNLGERSITRLSYRLPEACRDGGTLDLRPQDSRFP
jgi:hypothetical protein